MTGVLSFSSVWNYVLLELKCKKKQKFRRTDATLNYPK